MIKKISSLILGMGIISCSSLYASMEQSSLHELYEWCSFQLLVIEEDVQSLDEFKQILRESDILTGTSIFRDSAPLQAWSEEKWQECFSVITQRKDIDLENEDTIRSLIKEHKRFEFSIPRISLSHMSTLLHDGRSMLKSHLATEDDIAQLDELFLDKGSSINRLFTCLRIQQYLTENKCSHVTVPRKIVVIKDRNTGACLSSQEAAIVIDDIIKICMTMSFTGEITIDQYSQQYQLHIYAEKIVDAKKHLNDYARQELGNLCEAVPFDVGHTNIFTQENGDALIIDTEFKKANEHCKEDLRRYK